MNNNYYAIINIKIKINLKLKIVIKRDIIKLVSRRSFTVFRMIKSIYDDK